jgi:PAS domain S-box-containing protein
MTRLNIESSDQARLRLAADTSLSDGTAPPSKGWTISGDVLALLYRLASDPVTAGDALKLLHELQAHQVELDLQQAQLEANERAFAEDLAHYKALYDFAPVGYFIVGLEGLIIDGNLAGASLLGVGPTEFRNQSVDSYLAPESRPAFAELLNALREGGSSASCDVRPRHGANSSRRFRVAANRSADGDVILMVVSEYDLSQET